MKVGSGQEVTAAVASESANILLYGGPGLGKTTEAVKAFVKDGRCTAFFVQCEPGALKPIAATDLPMPDTPIDEHTGNVRTIIGWLELSACVYYVAQNRAKYNAIIIDTLTAWTTTTSEQLKAQGFGGKNGWAIPMEIYSYLTHLRYYARQLGIHVVYTAHARPPAVEDGVFYPGGPETTPKRAGSYFHGAVDTMIRVELMQLGGQMRRVYYTGGLDWDTTVLGLAPPSWQQWFQKNRDGVQQAVVPADLGAYLRARKPPYPGL